jgi:Carboxypeptidase regulatory-like domain
LSIPSRATRISPSVALVFVVLVLSGVSVRAQSERDRSQLRTVQGYVLDKSQNPIVNGIVYLRNKKTDNIRTQISDSQGHYQFTGLDPNVDFEIHAQYKKLKSSRHTISTFDDRRHIDINLIIPINK